VLCRVRMVSTLHEVLVEHLTETQALRSSGFRLAG
jgi:hypothetical protein